LPSEPNERRLALADPKLYADLRRYVQGRVPRGDAEDVVHAALTDALAAETAPGAPEELRRWIYAIARNKVADYYRRTRQQRPLDEEADELAAESAPHAASDLLKWAVQELPKDGSAHDTLEWMLREGDGDPLEEIAKENQVPAPRLRQRVSRLRRYYRSRWTAHLAALGLLALLGIVGYRWLDKDEPGPHAPPIARENPSPADSARALRRLALDDCEWARFAPCLERLERADQLDPRGAGAPELRAAREAATRALTPIPSSTPTPAPTVAPIPSGNLTPTPAPSSTDAPTPTLTPSSVPRAKASSDFTGSKPRATQLAPTSAKTAKPASKTMMGLDSALLDLSSDEAKSNANVFRAKK